VYKMEEENQAHPYEFWHSFQDRGTHFEIFPVIYCRVKAQKPRQRCLLGLKVSDSDRGVETVIFR
jgi:hypothetical protein